MAITFPAILSLDVAAGYEGRFAYGAANANVGVDVVSVSSPAPPVNQGGINCMNFGEGKTLANASLPSELFSVDTATTFNIDPFYIRFSSISDLETHATTEVAFIIAENTTDEWKLVVYQTGVGTHGVKLVHGSAPTTTTVTTSTPFSDDTWHRVTISWTHTNVSAIKVWIDNTEYLSTVGDMLNTAGDAGTVRYRFAGQVNGSAPNALHTETYMWGFMHSKGNTVNAETATYGIKVFRPFEKRGTTPDCNEAGGAGDTLFAGDALNITDDSSSAATLRSDAAQVDVKGMAWATDKLQGKSGPNGYFNDTAVGIACNWQIWHGSSNFGADNEEMIYGNYDQATDAYDVATVAAPRGRDFKVSHVDEVGTGKFPDILKEFAVIGISTLTGVAGQNVDLEEAWVDYAYEFDNALLLDRIPLKGSMTLNGSMVLGG